MRYFAFLVVSFIFLSCEINYESGNFSSEFEEDIPQTVLLDFVQTENRAGGTTLLLEAERAEYFHNREETRLTGVKYKEYDADGELVREGKADTVMLKDNEDAEISGEIEIYSREDEAGLKAESLVWMNEDKQLLSPDDSTVTIEKDDGSVLQGKSFFADFNINTIRFNKRVRGRIVSGEEDE